MNDRDIIQFRQDTKIPGLRIWCDYCKTSVKLTCRKNGKTLAKCEHIQRLHYRAIIYVPGVDQRVVRSLGKYFDKALHQLVILKEQVKSGRLYPRSSFSSLPGAIKIQPKILPPQAKPALLIHLFGRYLAELQGQGIASHLKVERSKPHITDVKNCFKQFCYVIRCEGYDLMNFCPVDISDELVGKFHEYLVGKQYGNVSYNRFFSHLTTFACWAEREGYGSIKRFFERVPRRKVIPRPEALTAEEFEKLLSVISCENGFQYAVGKEKQTRNRYQPYLASALRFALYTGRRREEIVTVRFSDIYLDETGQPLIISFTDHKVSRILHVAPGEERKVYTPVTKELAALLDELGFQEKKESDDFIIAPQLRQNRIAFLGEVLTRGFSHFWKVAFADSAKDVSFKTLRKTYLTNLSIHMGGAVRPVSGHSSEQVLKHYIDAKMVAMANSLRDFSVFKNAAPAITSQ